MSTTTTENKKSSMPWWIIFVVSTVICIYMVMFVDEWFWVMLPFVFTSLVKALDVI